MFIEALNSLRIDVEDLGICFCDLEEGDIVVNESSVTSSLLNYAEGCQLNFLSLRGNNIRSVQAIVKKLVAMQGVLASSLTEFDLHGNPVLDSISDPTSPEHSAITELLKSHKRLE